MRELDYLRHAFSGWSKLRQYARDKAQQAESRGRERYSLVIRRKNVPPRACPGRRSREGPARTSPVRGEPVGQLAFLRLVKTLLKVIGKVFTSNSRLLFGTWERRPTLASPLTTTAQFVQHRLEGGALADVRDILVTDAHEGNSALNARIAFGREGMLYMATGGNLDRVAQEPGSLRGKILRVRDDGSVPPDNPFVGRAGYRPEIYTLGHRNSLGLIVHPETGAVWNNENGPNGGDEINIILPGRNYGWPLISFGRDYLARVFRSTRRGKAWSLPSWCGYPPSPRLE